MWKLSIAVFVVVFVDLFGASLHAQRHGLVVRVDGLELASGRVLSIVVDGDADNPDAALVALIPDAAPSHFFGRGLDIASIDGEIVFNGEVIEALATGDRSGRRPIVTIRALNRAHRLTHEKRTRTFVGRSDADIARQLAMESGLQAEIGTDVLIQHDHVHQQNQTDLEFLMERASRIGYEVVVDHTTLHFRRRRASLPTAIGCKPNAVLLNAFLVKLSSASSAVEVSVRGWDPVKKEPIIGKARQEVIALSTAASNTDPRPATVDLGFVEALQTGATSYAAAAGTLSALTARNLSSEMRVEGSASLRAGGAVVLQGAGSAFDGEYNVTQTHIASADRAIAGTRCCASCAPIARSSCCPRWATKCSSRSSMEMSTSRSLSDRSGIRRRFHALPPAALAGTDRRNRGGDLSDGSESSWSVTRPKRGATWRLWKGPQRPQPLRPEKAAPFVVVYFSASCFSF